jgi:hypothetical protein
MPRNKSGSANGGVIGKTNKTSFGKLLLSKHTGNITAQQALELFTATLIAGGASGGSNQWRWWSWRIKNIPISKCLWNNSSKL